MNDALTATAIAEPPPLPDVTSPLKVLLIEDNAIDARLIQIMLSEAGSGLFELHRADRLGSGLRRLAEGDIGLVLLDLSLPDSYGLATFAAVHHQGRGVPIIVMSGLDDQTVAVNAVHEGAQDYLVKGQVSGQLLVRAMRYAIERKRTADQLAQYAEELRLRNVQMEADFTMAREIQQVFLPRQYPAFPRGTTPSQSALRFSHRYLPAAAVGGDFFNIFPITDTLAGVFICDVMGHGMRAALVTAIMRGMVEQLMPAAIDPGEFLTAINHSMHVILEQTEEPMLATAIYVVVDLAEREIRFASAGHPSPFRISRQQGTAQPFKHYDKSHGPALGLFENSTYPVGRCPLEVNDLILLFTDGLYEVPAPDSEEYGPERLLAAVRKRVTLNPGQLFDELLTEVKEFASENEFEDDVCLIGIEVQRLEAHRGPPS
jgi:sigma-B regulation protein RsbU (phosphoserine phosphatase)